MHFNYLSFSLVPLASAFWPHHGPSRYYDPLTVSTSSGQIHGKVDHDLPNVNQFLGIPFAAPPVGDLRWKAPQPLNQPHKHIEATELPPSCMQYLGTGASVYSRDVLEFNLQGLNKTGSVSEDCLTLSVWAPAKTKTTGRWGGRHHWSHGEEKGLPVFIFVSPLFYGGGFSTGGEDVPYQIPAQWVNRKPDHLVVSLNYRLNIFGFPNAGGLEDENLGLLDQRAAVEWCKKNIAGFGGDPDRMVIWGQSAGSQSVDLYNFAYADDPVVSGLIMDSGTAQRTFINDKTHGPFNFVADHVGCSGLAADSTKQLACMRSKSAETIEGFIQSYSESGQSPSIGSFSATIDDKVVFSNYTARALGGHQAKIPAIVGTNAQDGVPFAPYNANGPNQTEVLEQLLSHFFCPATETIRLRQQTGLLTYRYLYAGNFTNISPRPWMGAYHSAELPMLMGTHSNFRSLSTDLEYATSHAFQDAYVAFASDSKNGLAGQNWKPYELGGDTVREFGAGVAAQNTNIKKTEMLCNGAVPAM